MEINSTEGAEMQGKLNSGGNEVKKLGEGRSKEGGHLKRGN